MRQCIYTHKNLNHQGMQRTKTVCSTYQSNTADIKKNRDGELKESQKRKK